VLTGVLRVTGRRHLSFSFFFKALAQFVSAFSFPSEVTRIRGGFSFFVLDIYGHHSPFFRKDR